MIVNDAHWGCVWCKTARLVFYWLSKMNYIYICIIYITQYAIIPVPVKQPWRVRVNRSHGIFCETLFYYSHAIFDKTHDPPPPQTIHSILTIIDTGHIIMRFVMIVIHWSCQTPWKLRTRLSTRHWNKLKEIGWFTRTDPRKTDDTATLKQSRI